MLGADWPRRYREPRQRNDCDKEVVHGFAYCSFRA